MTFLIRPALIGFASFLLMGTAHAGRPAPATPPAPAGASATAAAAPGKAPKARRPKPKKTLAPKGWFGVSLKGATPDAQALLGVERPIPVVTRVFPGSPAETFGMAQGDQILTFNGDALQSVRDLIRRVGSTAPGTTIHLDIVHEDGRAEGVSIKLALKPNMRSLARDAVMHAPLPSLDVRTLDGALMQLGGGRGHGEVWIIDWFATWCGPCKRLSPALDAMQREHGADGLNIVAVSGETSEVLTPYVDAHPTAYTVASDEGKSVQRALMASVMPTLWFVDRSGTVVDVMYGVGNLEGLKAKVRDLLDTPYTDAMGRRYRGE